MPLRHHLTSKNGRQARTICRARRRKETCATRSTCRCPAEETPNKVAPSPPLRPPTQRLSLPIQGLPNVASRPPRPGPGLAAARIAVAACPRGCRSARPVAPIKRPVCASVSRTISPRQPLLDQTGLRCTSPSSAACVVPGASSWSSPAPSSRPRASPASKITAWLGVAIVSAFGIFGCVQFLRGKSAKTLLLALTVGVVFDLIGDGRLPGY